VKIKNKKKINVIVAAFMTVFMVGAVFAFTAQSNLIFQGTSNVDAALQLLITDIEYMGHPAHVNNGITIDTDIAAVGIAGHNGMLGVRTVDFTVNFNGLNQAAQFAFTVTNTGTIPARVYDFVRDTWGVDGHVDGVLDNELFEEIMSHQFIYRTLWHLPGNIFSPVENLIDLVLEPGESVVIHSFMQFARTNYWSHPQFPIPEFWSLGGEYKIQLELEYVAN
jgi:hypothetical protein